MENIPDVYVGQVKKAGNWPIENIPDVYVGQVKKAGNWLIKNILDVAKCVTILLTSPQNRMT